MTVAPAKPTPLAVVLGVRNLDERRQKLDKMYSMIQNVQRGIVGEGFTIQRHDDPRCGEFFEVYRKGYGTERVTSLTRVATMFTPEMFCDGCNGLADCLTNTI